ncbi:hypothetical protein NMY22_g3652 [Coprinellus aureogranulatus]|nr:hypothetical protein NMY22_g3652 [Coprinellus aureogranulatus]
MLSEVPTSAGDQNPFKRIFKRLCSSKLNLIVAFRKPKTVRSPADDYDVPGPRRALQTSIVVFDVAFSVAETIPVFGGPLKGALEALCKVLKLVEVRQSQGHV